MASVLRGTERPLASPSKAASASSEEEVLLPLPLAPPAEPEEPPVLPVLFEPAEELGVMAGTVELEEVEAGPEGDVCLHSQYVIRLCEAVYCSLEAARWVY